MISTDIAVCDKPADAKHEVVDTWHQPTPLAQISMPEIDYPIDALPSILQKAVMAYHQYGQQPLSLIANSCKGSLS